MTRRRWISAKWPITMREIARRMQKADDIQENEKGFIVERVRDDFVEAKYFERLQTIERLIDPFGRESEIDRVQYLQINFTAFDGPLGLEIVGTSKDVRKLTNSLEKICEYKLILSAISVDPIAWAVEISRCSGIEYYTESIQISNMYVGPGISAKLVVTGTVDVGELTGRFVHDRSHVIEKVKIQAKSRPKSSVILTNGAAATTAGAESGRISSAVRESLLVLMGDVPEI